MGITKLGTLIAVAALAITGTALPVRAQPLAATWTVTGPSGSTLTATLDLDGSGTPHLAVARSGQQVLMPGKLGITAGGHDLSAGLSFVQRQDRAVTESYRMTTGKRLGRSAAMTESTFTFRAADGTTLGVVVRVSTDGVAYRYLIGGTGQVTVQREASTFSLPTDATAWVQPYDAGYETERTQTTAATANQAQPATCTGSTCAFGYPTLFKVQNNYALLTESDVDGRYSGSHLSHLAGSGDYSVVLAGGSAVTATGPLSTPWRTAIIGDLNTVVGSTFVDDLAPPARFTDTSWIRPGVADWSWLSGGNPGDPAVQRHYIDFAGAHGLEYTLVDAGWQQADIPELVRYAHARGVQVLLWFDWNDLRTQAQRNDWLPKVKAWGVAGVKVDYMNSDAQSQFQWYDAILADTAAQHLMINFHGATIPRGLQRTWPHVMGVEAVRGEENGQNPARDIYLAFTRNVVGSMDYTPTWFSRSGRQNSLAHELALPVVYESGWTHLGDSPEGFDAQPEGERYLEQLPTVWDDTRLAAGAPGDRQVVMARRSGDRWFVGGILAGTATTMTAPLSFLGTGTWLLETVRDNGGTLARSTSTVTAGSTLSVAAPANGGFASILCPADGRSSCDTPVVPAARTGPITSGIAGKCVAAAGGKVTISDCDGSASQQWTVSGGALSNGTQCMDVYDNQTANGTLVELWPCNKGSNQAWYPGTKPTLVSAQSGRCLDDPFSSTVNGTQLAIWDCSGDPNQQWHLPA